MKLRSRTANALPVPATADIANATDLQRIPGPYTNEAGKQKRASGRGFLSSFFYTARGQSGINQKEI
jgi:hypothetical protein